MIPKLIIIIFSFLFSTLLIPDNNVYRTPPNEIKTLAEAPRSPTISLSSSLKYLLILKRPTLLSLDELSQSEISLAGLKINPNTNSLSRNSYYNNITLLNIETGEIKEINSLPDNPKLQNILWSPNGESFGFTNLTDTSVELYIYSIENSLLTKIPNLHINNLGSGLWLSDSVIIVTVVPKNRHLPPENSTSTGPIIQENIDISAPARTYQDLLKNPNDEKLFKYYFTSQIVSLNINGELKKIGNENLYRSIDASPNGQYLLITYYHRPFSYLVPYYRFPMKIEIWDLQGNIIKTIADLPLAEQIPIGRNSVREGEREISWRNDLPATLFWVEAQDEGDPNKDVEIRDKCYILDQPFNSEPIELSKLSQRYRNIFWCNDTLALLSEYWWETRNIKYWIINPHYPEVEKKLLFDYSWEDLYNAPGTPITRYNNYGRNILKLEGVNIFLNGYGASSEGVFPYLDKLDLITNTRERLWQCEAPFYEYFYQFIDDTTFITGKESVEQPRNYYINFLNNNEQKQLTFFPHPTPQLIGITKEFIHYKREDSVNLTATLYLPKDYSKERDGPLPLLMWAYPTEFKSASNAGQIRESQYRFTRVGWWSPILWVTQGYAILDYPDMPIIGEGENQPNDTYIQQLIMNAEAAIDEVVKRGVVDPDRVAIGGHSYGAFMTANLLTHSDLFAAGIARTGAYNRTLTPFGFQSEQRNLWEAPEIYFKMSPFLHVDKINTPILLFHGLEDNNSGTFPMQSERYFNALKGLGKTARLVLLPYESHSYRAEESVMHVLWEMSQWLDRYLKDIE